MSKLMVSLAELLRPLSIVNVLLLSGGGGGEAE